MSKRADGYHEIASLYQAVDLCDRLFFSLSDKDQITCTDPNIPCDGSNLVSKALALFRTQHSTPCVKIDIEKHIPIQAGLGGGSSNAATTLWALNQLTGCPFTQEKLIEMAAKIGSDVPFFFSPGTAYCTGRGELLGPHALPEPLSGFIAKPFYGLSTPLVYEHTRLSELSDRDPLEALHDYPQFFNDLEVSAFRLEPRLRQVREVLQENFSHVVMTGSGTAFFCLDGNPKPIEGVTFFPFKSLQRVTLSDWWKDLPDF